MGGSARGRYGLFFLPSEAGQAFFDGDGCGSNGAGGAPRLCQVRVWCWLRQNGVGEGYGGSFSVTWQFWELARSRCFRIRRCDDVAPSRNRQVLLSLRARGRRPFTQHTHWQGTLLECGSRPSLACTSTRALRSGSDGVARWWRRHDDEQEAGPVSAALLNAFLNSADFFCRAYMWSNRAIAGSLG